MKWFDAYRGFGFVVIDGIETDFLLHQNILHGFGRTSIAEGSSVEFAYQSTENGFKIIEIFAIAPPSPRAVPDPQLEPDVVLEERIPVRVKWFDPSKGYGFVNAFGCAEDIFVGAATLRKSMLGDLQSGDALCVQIAETEGRKSVFSVHDWC
ncbi:cold shock protein [Roseobacter sp. CCS2]|nr:cold shock protein [Roseobacter sp. CCS2]